MSLIQLPAPAENSGNERLCFKDPNQVLLTQAAFFELNKRHIQALARFFPISPAAFFFPEAFCLATGKQACSTGAHSTRRNAYSTDQNV